MRTRTMFLTALCVAIALIPLPAGRAQEAEPPDEGGSPAAAASQPTTQPTSGPVNRLITPHRALQLFLRTVRDTDAGPERYDAAMMCLDLDELDPAVRKVKGAEYVRQLAEILVRLEEHGVFDPEDHELFPDEPTIAGSKLLSFGRDPIVLVLERMPRVVRDPNAETEQTVQEWRFSASTVAEIPKWYADLDALSERLAKPTTTAASDNDAVDPASLSSPYQTMVFFLDSAEAAEDDGSYYAAAFACLDFSEVLADAVQAELELEDPAAVDAVLKQRGPEYVRAFIEQNGVAYVDGLAKIIGVLRDSGTLELADLPRSLTDEHKGIWAIGGKPLELVLIRQADGLWRFGRTTIRNVPAMLEHLTQRAAPPSAEARPVAAAGEGEQPGPADVAAPLARSVAAPGHVAREFRSARAVMRTFRKAMQAGDLEKATECLDLAKLSEAEREIAHVLAGKLWLVMLREEQVPLAEVPAAPGGPSYELLARPAGRIEIDRQGPGDRAGEWLFTARTVRDIEDLYETVQREPVHESWKDARISFWTLPSLYVREYVVPAALKQQLVGLQAWQWLGVVLVLVLGLAVFRLSQWILPWLSRVLLRSEGAEMLPRVLQKALRPTSNLAMVAAWWGGLQSLDLGASVMAWTWMILRVVLTVVAVYASYRLIDVVMSYFTARAARTKSRLDDVLVPLARTTLKVAIAAVGIVFVANALGFQINPLLAGLGIGGLAFSFAAKDTIANFFGSVNVVLDRPFQVGDWVKIGNAEGTVESVGMRSSRIRTFYNSQMTIPNAEIMNAVVDNMGRRRYRRTSTALSVTYSTTPEQLEAFCEGIREIIRRHPDTRKDYFHVYVKEFASSSIDIMLYCFHECPDWSAELRERHRLYLDIARLAQRLGVEWAFPTQTIHLHNEDAAATPTSPKVPRKPEQALTFGKEQAAAIVAEFNPSKDA